MLDEQNYISVTTWTTRTPVFWDNPAAPWLPTLVIHIRNFEILQETLQVTHPLKLLDKMYKYEMDPTRTVGATEWTRDAGQTDGRSETNIPPNNFVVQGYNKERVNSVFSPYTLLCNMIQIVKQYCIYSMYNGTQFAVTFFTNHVYFPLWETTPHLRPLW